MRIVGNNPQLSRQTQATASGAITGGKPVVVNTDGTVTQISETTQILGSEVVFESASSKYTATVFDSNSNRIVVAYQDEGNSNYGTAIVGTVSGTSISFGTPVVFEYAQANDISATFDSNSNKVVIVYGNAGDSTKGTATVGTVDPSDNSISFGSGTVFEAGGTYDIHTSFDSSNNKVVIVYKDAGNSYYFTSKVATVSGSSISFGTTVVIASANYNYFCNTFDSSNNKVVIGLRGSGNHGQAYVGTVSGTSISWGTVATFHSSGAPRYMDAVFDTNSNKVVFSYMAGVDSDHGYSVVGTVSGTDITFGTPVEFRNADLQYTTIAFDSSVNKVVIGFREDDDSNKGKLVVGTVSGTAISFGSPVEFNGGTTAWISSAFDSSNNKVVISYKDNGNSGHGTSINFANAVPTNITSENFIGFAQDTVATGQPVTINTKGAIVDNIPQLESASSSVGTEVQFEAGDTRNTDATFDSNSNRIVIVYRDVGNSSYGSVVVGTVDPSDNSISFGTPVVFESANSEVGDVVFDSSNNKVVVFYTDNGNSSYGTAIVGTVDSSDNSISFGSATTFLDATSYYYGIDATFDSSNNKIVIAYRDGGDSNKGKAKVGTVSGTSISFGSATEFEAGTTAWIGSTFDTSNNKVVITYQDAGNSDYGTAVVGTVSGTSISFGTPVVFASNASLYTSPVFDSDNNKIVIAYQNNSLSPAQPFAIVGTVSGTSISFGTAVTAGSSFVGIYTHAVYNSNAKKTVVSWADSSDTKGRFSSLSISGTSITWDTAALYNNGSSDWNAIAFDSSNNRVVIPWAETAGKAVVVKSLGTLEDLTPAQTYFVQTDGTLSETADDPSVTAGTAVAGSTLIVKG